MLIKIQPDATVCRYLFTAKSLYMFRVSQHPSSGVLKTVTATSGTGHNTGTPTSLQRGLQATLEGSRCGTNTATVGKNSKDQCFMCSESDRSSMSSFGILNSLACKMLFYHHRQPTVSEAKKSHSPALPICLEVCQLAHKDITHYQTQPLTCVICSALIFILPTFTN